MVTISGALRSVIYYSAYIVYTVFITVYCRFFFIPYACDIYSTKNVKRGMVITKAYEDKDKDMKGIKRRLRGPSVTDLLPAVDFTT